MKILLLGDKGLLGNDLKLLDTINKDLNIVVLSDGIKRWPHHEFKQAILDNDCDILINAISSTDYYNEDVIKSIHCKLPVWLAKNKPCKIILFSSDIVNRSQSETVDDKFKNYAAAKRSMENDLRLNPNVLCIRTSFLGLTKTKSNLIYRLFELNTNEVINVSDNSFWSGITTLELYNFIAGELLKNWRSGVLIMGCEKSSIYELFVTINDLFSYSKKIVTMNDNTFKDRSSRSDIVLPSISEQLQNLKAIAQLLKNSNITYSEKII